MAADPEAPKNAAEPCPDGDPAAPIAVTPISDAHIQTMLKSLIDRESHYFSLSKGQRQALSARRWRVGK